MREGLKEVTGTCDGFRYPENIYILNDAGKLEGYIREGETVIQWYSKPLAFYKTRRKFKKVKV